MDIIDLWWLGLAIFSVVVVVVAVLLGLIIATARNINQHAEAIWVAGKQIAGNTVSIWMLEKTTNDMEKMVDGVRDVRKTAVSMDEKLEAIARSARRGG